MKGRRTFKAAAGGEGGGKRRGGGRSEGWVESMGCAGKRSLRLGGRLSSVWWGPLGCMLTCDSHAAHVCVLVYCCELTSLLDLLLLAAGGQAQDKCLEAAEECVEGLSSPAWIKACSCRRCRVHAIP